MTKIAVLPGDGIGPEVIAAGTTLLEETARLHQLELDLTHFPLGASHYLETGETLPQSTFEELRDGFDAIYVGAFGDPRVPKNEHARDILLGLRFRLDLYVNLRPCRLLADDLGVLRGKGPKDIDFVIFRENTQGLYTGHGRRVQPDTPDELAVSEMHYTYAGVERVVRAAFDYARRHGLTRVCMSDKANAVEHTGALWQRVFWSVAELHPEIEARHLYVDVLAMEMVRAPEQFDVIVTGNLFGDIVSDLGAQLQGGIGTASSANVHPGRIGLFEPVHGSAPTIVGQGIANPVAAFLTAAMMLDHLGSGEAAQSLRAAAVEGLRAGVRTPDLGGNATTDGVRDDVLRRLRAQN